MACLRRMETNSEWLLARVYVGAYGVPMSYDTISFRMLRNVDTCDIIREQKHKSQRGRKDNVGRERGQQDGRVLKQ